MQERFNLRVYGILINNRNEVLVSDELRFGKLMTKFPGGGLEWGEGSKDCVQREWKEEIGIDIEVGELIYVNDFFQASAFRKTDQLLSFYYEVKFDDWEKIQTVPIKEKRTEEGEQFRWAKINSSLIDELTFPIDKVVAEKLINLSEK